MARGRRVRGHPLRARRGDRPDHDQPARGPQRLSPADAGRAARRLHPRPRRHRGRRDHLHRRRRRGVLLRAATSGSAATTATSATTRSPSRASAGSTSATCTCRSAACPKPVLAAVAGYAVGGGQILHLVCDLSIAADNAVFGQTGPRVGSFDGGFGAGLLARAVGVRKAKEIWFLCRLYDADEALEMGLVNAVVPLAELERESVAWCREMTALSPLSLRLLKSSFNAAEDGLTGLQQLSHDATLLFYMTEEGQEGRNAYKEGRRPDFSKFPKRPLERAAHLADGGAAADAAGGDRAGAGRHARRRARRPSRATSAGAPSSPPSSARSSSRSAPTSPTTTPTPSAAPTPPTGSGRSGSPRPAWSRRGGCCTRPGSLSRVAVAAGIYLATVAGPGDHRRRRRLDPRRRPLHRRAAALRLRGHGRALRLPLLRPRRGQRLLLRAARGARLAAVRALDPGRHALDRDPRRQQRPRHRHRPPRRQAHARGAARPRADAARSIVALVVGAFVALPVGLAGRRRARPGRCSRCSRRRSRSRRPRGRAQRTDGPALNARARRRPAPCSAASACCSPPAC